MTGRQLTVLAWPARKALQNLQRTDEVFVISIETVPTSDRTVARKQIRTALSDALGVLTGCEVLRFDSSRADSSRFDSSRFDSSRFSLDTLPGQPLQMVGTHIGVSISHEAGMSVAAIHLHGPVGIDIVRRDAIAQAEADWPMLARDYLGPAASERISQANPAQRLQIFATEWTAQEACLKCRGLGLVEWDATRESVTEFDLHPLVLPLQWIGMLAVEKRRV